MSAPHPAKVQRPRNRALLASHIGRFRNDDHPCGFAASNYGKVKLALLEKKNVEERFTFPSDDPEFRASSPRGKIPFIRVDGGAVCESQPIVDISRTPTRRRPLSCRSARARTHPLADPNDGVVRRVGRTPFYGPALFGLPIPPGQKDQTAEDLKAGVVALKRMVRFSPFVGGKDLSLADMAAVWHLPTVRNTMKAIYGDDKLAELAGLDDYLAMMHQRPHVATVEQGRKAGMEPFIAAVKKKFGIA